MGALDFSGIRGTLDINDPMTGNSIYDYPDETDSPLSSAINQIQSNATALVSKGTALSPISAAAAQSAVTQATQEGGGAVASGGTSLVADTLAGLAGGAKDATGAPTGIAGQVADYFARGVVIILGFIFVAIGLSMFKGTAPAVAPIISKLKVVAK